MEAGSSLAVDLDRRDLEHEASGRYKRYIVRSRLKRVPHKAMKSNALAREEEERRFFQYIESLKSLDGRVSK